MCQNVLVVKYCTNTQSARCNSRKVLLLLLRLKITCADRPLFLLTTLATCTAVLLSAQAGSAHTRANREAHLANVQAQNTAIHSGSVVRAAYAFRGTRYVMGGTSRSGFDCSGFVRYILGATNGVSLPRTATEQYYHGNKIPDGLLQPGDLVFFKNTYKHGISHVGIYVGSGEFVHAANSHKGVRKDRLSDHYYQAHYAGARRVLPAQMAAAPHIR